MKIKGNIDEIPAEFIWSDKAGLMTKELGKYAGSEKIGGRVLWSIRGDSCFV